MLSSFVLVQRLYSGCKARVRFPAMQGAQSATYPEGKEVSSTTLKRQGREANKSRAYTADVTTTRSYEFMAVLEYAKTGCLVLCHHLHNYVQFIDLSFLIFLSVLIPIFYDFMVSKILRWNVEGVSSFQHNCAYHMQG
jgi:hypothetical protein